MKKTIFALLAATLLTGLLSCASDDAEDVGDIKDALKISAWVLDRDLEGKGYWEKDYSLQERGYWVPDEGEQAPAGDVFSFERLEPGEVRVMAPMGYMSMPNLNVLFEFDGIIEIIPEDPEARLVQLGYTHDRPTEPTFDFSTSTYDRLSLLGPRNINFCPLGESTRSTSLIRTDTLKERVYDFQVNTYRLDGTPVVSAGLRLTVLDDKVYPRESYYELVRGGADRSRFLSVEVTSYEYSDALNLK